MGMAAELARECMRARERPHPRQDGRMRLRA